MKDDSLYANCCPRQMRGPALKGRKMNGFGVRYFATRSSRKRSGSNPWAVCARVRRNGEAGQWGRLTVGPPEILPAVHEEYRIGASSLRRNVEWFLARRWGGPDCWSVCVTHVEGSV